MDRQWKLGVNHCKHDNLLDGFTFDDVITALQCNEPVIDEAAVRRTVKNMLELRMQDLEFLLKNNMKQIIKEAK